MADIHTSHIDYGALPRAVRKFRPGCPGCSPEKGDCRGSTAMQLLRLPRSAGGAWVDPGLSHADRRGDGQRGAALAASVS